SSARRKDAAQALGGLQEEQVETQLAGRGDVTAPRRAIRTGQSSSSVEMTSSLATGDRLPDDAHETARDRITKTILRRGRACRVFACPPLAMGTTTLDRSN